MGSSDSKSGQGSTKLSPKEVEELKAIVEKSKSAGRSLQEGITRDLNFHVGSVTWLNAIWTMIARNSKNPDFEALRAVYETAVYGSLEEHVAFIESLLQETKLPLNRFSLWLVQGAETSSHAWSSWSKIRCAITDESRASFVEFLSKKHSGKAFKDLEELLMRRPIILTLLKAVFRHGFSCDEGHPNNLFPMVVDPPDPVGPKPTILSSTEVLFLNSLLPHDLMSEWRLLFSSARHGQSFSTLLGRIVNKGPTVIIIRDSDKHTFGGFASVSWTIGPNFAGDNRCFLFSLQPTMAMFVTTGYNDHYMYLNQQQETLPNGLGMGGQHDYFGFWLDAEYGIGHSSKTCTTYGEFFQLSKHSSFTIDHVEVWAVGKPPSSDTDENEPNPRSILDRDPSAKAILEMVDRGHHSEGLREPQPE